MDTSEKFVKYGDIKYSTAKYIPIDGSGQVYREGFNICMCVFVYKYIYVVNVLVVSV